jgi:hypothetical protein
VRVLTGRSPVPDEETSAGARAAALRLFAITWAMVTLFHVWVNPWALGVVHAPTQAGWTHVVLTVVALAVLVRPGSVRWLAVLAVLQICSAWLEAPYLGNHWLLVAFVAVALLLSLAAEPAEMARRFFPVARLCLLGCYSFAAVSKLNSGFFTPARSCGVFYARETMSSIGLPRVPFSGFPAWVPIVATVCIECSIPVLLLVPRTRVYGVITGICFHSVLALDGTHLFTDFSSVIVALLLLFLPVEFAPWLFGRIRGLRPYKGTFLVVAAVLSAGLWVWSGHDGEPVIHMRIDQLIYFGFAGLLGYCVVRYVWTARPEPAPLGVRSAPVWLLLVPALVVVNGLTPYLELKTGFGWNMYSNLVTVDGRSNHFLVRRTWPLTDVQHHLVTVVDSDDPGLQQYAKQHFRLPLLQLRVYAADHPGDRLTYEVGGVVRTAPRMGDDPLLARHVSWWQAKLELFRAVDTEDPPRCLDRWSAAR